MLFIIPAVASTLANLSDIASIIGKDNYAEKQNGIYFGCVMSGLFWFLFLVFK